MVKYYGRARQRIGSVNTNQIGLKMSGCPSKVGRQGYLSRYIGRRAQCNQKYCGPVYYHGVLWKWNSGRCVRSIASFLKTRSTENTRHGLFGLAARC